VSELSGLVGVCLSLSGSVGVCRGLSESVGVYGVCRSLSESVSSVGACRIGECRRMLESVVDLGVVLGGLQVQEQVIRLGIPCSRYRCNHIGRVGFPTAKCLPYISHMRNDLLRIIGNWEKSGQGCGSYGGDNGDDDISKKALQPDHFDFEKLTGRVPIAMNSLPSFHGKKPSYSLIFWELADQHQVLEHHHIDNVLYVQICPKY
jgi:hypothetical protein